MYTEAVGNSCFCPATNHPDNPDMVQSSTNGRKPSIKLRNGYANSLFLILATLFTLGALWHSYRVGINFGKIHSRQIDAVMQIEFELSNGHLWFEEVLSGDRNEPIDKTWKHYDTANWFVHALISGRKDEENIFYPPLSDLPHKYLLEEIDRKIEVLRTSTRKRWDQKGSSGPGTPIDQEYDRQFETIMHLTKRLRSHLMSDLQDDLASYQHTFTLVVPLIALLYLAGGIRIFLGNKRQQTATSKIRNHEKRLEHLYRILNTVRNVNQLITREKDPSSLIRKVADNLAGEGGYRETLVIRLTNDRKPNDVARSEKDPPTIPLTDEFLSEIFNQSSPIHHDEKRALIRHLLVTMLEPMGCQVLTAGNGIEATQRFEKEADKIDLVILDLGMPGMNGMDCFDRLTGIDPDVRIIIATGYPMNDEVRSMIDRGALGVLQKPFTQTRVSELIRKTLKPKTQN